MNKRWLVNRTNREFVNYLSKTANVSPIIAQILINRNIKTPSDIRSFFFSDIGSWKDPFELSGMDSAVERIRTAIKNGERMLIHGDYDADGTTATAILMEAIKRLGGEVDFFVPSRFRDGYGFSESAVEMAKDKNISLVITVDCGITSFGAVELANRNEIDVIITDHHEPAKSQTLDLLLPAAYSIINPRIQTYQLPIDNHLSSIEYLSGAGIALKLSLALFSGVEENMIDLLDIAAIGTVADMVPLIGENRVIVKEGLKVLKDSTRSGIRALMNVSGIGSRVITSRLLSFTMIPRVNAAGRMDDATDVVRLFVTESDEEAERIASWLNKLNVERQKVEEDVLESALRQIEHEGFDKVIAVACEGWHEGVLGVVASKIVDRFHTPTFVFSVKDGVAKGSARSISSYDICEGMGLCSDYLIRYGGHKQAAGLKLMAENLSPFKERIEEHIRKTMSEEDFVSAITIDADVILKDINFGLLHQLSQLAPFGYGNPEPLLGSKGLMARYPHVVGKNHLKMKLVFKATSVVSTMVIYSFLILQQSALCCLYTLLYCPNP